MSSVVRYQQQDVLPTSFMKSIKATAVMQMAQDDAAKSRDMSMKYIIAKEAVLAVIKSKDHELFALVGQIYDEIEDEPSSRDIGSKKPMVLNDDYSDDEDRPLKPKPGSKPAKPGSKPINEVVQEDGNKKGKKRAAPKEPKEFPEKNGQAGFIQYHSKGLKDDSYRGTAVLQEAQQRHRRCTDDEKVTYNILAELMNLHAEKEHKNVRKTLKPQDVFKVQLFENFLEFFNEPTKIEPLIVDLKDKFSKHQKFAKYVGKPIPNGPNALPPFPKRLPYPCPDVCEDNDGNEIRLDEQKAQLDADGNIIGKFKSIQMSTNERFEERAKFLKKLREAEEAEAEKEAGAEAGAEAEAETEAEAEAEEPKKKKKKVASKASNSTDESAKALDD